jgi:hypothetical protein
MSFSLIGIYPVEESIEPCYLVEAKIDNYKGQFDFGHITQEVENQPRDNWQVPWDEYLLNDEGTAGELAPFPSPAQIVGSQRIAFMIYYLDFALPLITPFGNISLLQTTNRPERLSFIEFDPPY